MSYCVNCGVELAETEKICPLCGVAVVNPAKPVSPAVRRSYPNVPVAGYRYGYRDAVAPISVFMLIPMSISVVCDALTNGRLSWSVYILASTALAFILIVPPLYLGGRRILLCLLFDWVGTALFLYVLDLATQGRWFFPVALPLSGAAGAAVLLLTAYLIKCRPYKLVMTALVLFLSGLFCVLAELLIDRYLQWEPTLGWSLYVLIPCALLALVALLINRSPRLKERVKQRIFF